MQHERKKQNTDDFMTGIQELVRQQGREFICGEFDHHLKIALPVEKRDDKRMVKTICSICHEEHWRQLPEDGYQRFLTDLASGKIK